MGLLEILLMIIIGVYAIGTIEVNDLSAKEAYFCVILFLIFLNTLGCGRKD